MRWVLLRCRNFTTGKFLIERSLFARRQLRGIHALFDQLTVTAGRVENVLRRLALDALNLVNGLASVDFLEVAPHRGFRIGLRKRCEHRLRDILAGEPSFLCRNRRAQPPDQRG